MKTKLTILSGLLSISLMVDAEVQNQVPDLGNALTGGKLIHRVDPKLMAGFQYEYGANASFENLKKDLKEFLGDDWEEKEENPRYKKAFRKVMEAQGIDLVGIATFSNPAFPEKKITLLMKHEKSEGKEWRSVGVFGDW